MTNDLQQLHETGEKTGARTSAGQVPALEQRWLWRGRVEMVLAPLQRAFAHDVRAPLNSMSLNLMLARRMLARDPAKAAHYLGVIDDEISNLASLFDPFFGVIGRVADPLAESPEEVDLAALVHELRPLATMIATRRQVALDVAVDAGTTRVQAPVQAVRLALMAAWVSALRSAPADTGHTLTLTAGDGGVQLELEIADPEARSDAAAVLEAVAAPVSGAHDNTLKVLFVTSHEVAE